MSGCRTHNDHAETRLARLTRLRCTQVPGNAKHINLRWRLPNNGVFAEAAPQPADYLAEYRATHASEVGAQERGQLQGWGAERDPMLQVECMKERTRADELALELERANARNQELQLRIDTLLRDLALRPTLRTDEPEASGLHGDVAGEQRTLQEQLAAVTAQLEGVQAEAAALHGRLVHKEAELLAAQAEAATQRRRVAETEEVLRESKSGSSALEARGYQQYEQLIRAQSEAAEWESRSRRWSKERADLQQKLNDATRQASRRRDELYFTRTNMLREQLKLRQELEGTLPPRVEGGARLGHTTAQPAVHRHTTTSASHWTVDRVRARVRVMVGVRVRGRPPARRTGR